jgi:hypothetical protein
MLPLGGAWAGSCHANPEPVSQPKGATFSTLCNLGYARGTCHLFPPGDGPDAVRFTISSDDGVTLRLYYAVEQDHHPFQHGRLEYSRTTQAFEPSPVSQALVVQARAYVESYLMRKSGAALASFAASTRA